MLIYNAASLHILAKSVSLLPNKNYPGCITSTLCTKPIEFYSTGSQLKPFPKANHAVLSTFSFTLAVPSS